MELSSLLDLPPVAAASLADLGGSLQAPSLDALLAGENVCLLESSGSSPQAQAVILGTEPLFSFRSKGGQNFLARLPDAKNQEWTEEPLEALRRVMDGFPRLAPNEGLPFCGGAIGAFSYELGRRILPVAPVSRDDLGLPEISLLFFDRFLIRTAADAAWKVVAVAWADSERAAGEKAREKALLYRDLVLSEAGSAPPERVARPDAGLELSLDEAQYQHCVSKCREEIFAGEAYELCLTGRFETRYRGDPLDIYRALRRASPAPFSAYLRLPEATLISSSPERFLKAEPSGKVEARPIKGTRARGDNESEDKALRRDLADSEKDRAENIMIVDLLRNDLKRVCEPGSVEVAQLCAIEPYANVFQMTSSIRGRLREGCDRIDLLESAFPGGSMTGAPKIAAMRILENLEPVVRGFYSGALGYLGWDGGMDLSIIIRTLTLIGERVLIGAGGAIVADSDPQTEWQEAVTKAAAPLRAAGGTALGKKKGAEAPGEKSGR